MTLDDKAALLNDIPEASKHDAARALFAYLEALADQMHEEHGEAWRTRYATVEGPYAARFMSKLATKLAMQ